MQALGERGSVFAGLGDEDARLLASDKAVSM